MSDQTSARAVYVISVAAELAGVHPQTLRIYERKGLLEPARTGGGSRRYSDADLDLLRRIAASSPSRASTWPGSSGCSSSSTRTSSSGPSWPRPGPKRWPRSTGPIAPTAATSSP